VPDLGLVLAVAGIGLFDSLNPLTIAVGAFVASGERPVPRLAAYTAGIFAVYLAGGILLTLGPGALIRTATHRPDTTAVHIAYLIAGIGAIAFGAWVWRHRNATENLPRFVTRPHSPLALGAGITIVDLPTAIPYFGAIVAILDADVSTPSEAGLLVLFNLMYVAPLLAMVLALIVLRERAPVLLERLRTFVARWSPVVLALLSVPAGVLAIVAGVKGLAH